MSKENQNIQNKEYDIKKAISTARFETSFYIIFFVVLPLLALTYTFYNQMNERIDCSSLSTSSLEYLQDKGEILPANCSF